MTLQILLLCNNPSEVLKANTISDHISSFEMYSEHKIWTYSQLGDLPAELDLNRFDVVIVHYTISLLFDYYLPLRSKQLLRNFTGLKVLFVQDEYRQINKMIAEIKQINFDVLFTCFPDSEIEKIYPSSQLPNLVKHNNLTGYIPERLLKDESLLKSTSERPLDVGYRGRKIPFWLGELAHEKYSIVDKWHAFTQSENFKTDISYEENERIYGQKWIDFISSCKATLGVESGASVMDFTGKLEVLINYHQQMYPDDSFQEIQKMYLGEHEGKYRLNQISPRCFEAIALRTVLILYEGEYSGILIPGRHYIPLKKDFSNIKEVIARLRDNNYLQQMANIAYEEIALNPEYSYRSFIQKIDKVIETEFKCRSKNKVAKQLEYNEEDFRCAIQSTLWDQSIYVGRKITTEMNHLSKLLKFVVTHKIKIFNPLLRRIKNRFV